MTIPRIASIHDLLTVVLYKLRAAAREYLPEHRLLCFYRTVQIGGGLIKRHLQPNTY